MKEISPMRWKNMRRMAWLSLIAGLTFPAYLYVSPSDHLVNIAAPFYMFIGAVVGAYMGFSTWGDKDY